MSKMRGLIDRVILTIINLLFPPAAVYALCGFGLDLALNCVFFILAIIPSHIHGFYITCTYFHRRRKVRKGKDPGGEKPMIFSSSVTNGGASNGQVEEIRRREKGLPPRTSSRSSRRRSKDRKSAEMVQRHGSDPRRTDTRSSRTSSHRQHHLDNDPRYANHVQRDGYGQLSPPQSRPQRAIDYAPVSPVGSHVSARSERRRELV